MTGIYGNTKVSIPRNQIFVAFETTSTVAKRGFKASILENSIWYLYNNFCNSMIHFINEYAFVLIGDICQYWMDLENMKLSSPYFPQNYFDDGSVCDWFITAPEGNIISLEFDYFNVRIELYSK